MPKSIQQALTEARTLPPQNKVEIMRGFHVRLKRGGIPVLSLHYSAHPDRDPEIGKLHVDPKDGQLKPWLQMERSNYSSQGAWDREQEIKDYAGGGELVFADDLITHWRKIVIGPKSIYEEFRDPRWRPDPRWDCYGGFDHGKTNPTTLGRLYTDFAGNKYICGEYYRPGWEIWQHVNGMGEGESRQAGLADMADIDKILQCWADPSIFDKIHQQSRAGKDQGEQDEAKSTNDLYREEGVELFTKYTGDRSDWSSAQRVKAHWKNLEIPEVRPKLFIVCRYENIDAPRPGLHHWDSPNLLWEMMRARREKLSAQQLMSKNPSEKIVDKDNHARDAMLKYCLMNLPEPTQKTREDLLKERLAHIPQEDVTSRVIRGQEALQQIEEEDQPMISLGRSRGRRR